MENFETNDSNKVLTNDTSSEQSDAEGIKEQDVLKTDSSEEETPSDDIQDPVNVSADAQETTIDAKEDQETTGALEEVTEVIGDSEESPVTLEGSKTADKPSENMADMMDMYEESFKRFAEGEVVTGRIISVDKDYVLVDIGYKSEGQIRIQEFQGEDGNLVANEGDSVDVMVEWWDDEEERVVLSKEKAAKVKVWEAIKKSFDEDQTVEGVIVNRVKGGFSVDIGVQAFLPGSQADLRPIRNLDEMVGKTFTFKILKYNRKRSNIVLSR
ncbi:MAG: S1 RNA-binding domain-containing protein, partial [Desulfobacteraceae bacterium]|nr:S1 RNA-binding domain-containing protein [Desulfobacteraceae bacterium]